MEVILTWKQLDQILYDNYGVILPSSPTSEHIVRSKRKAINFDVYDMKWTMPVYYKVDTTGMSGN